MLGHFEVISGYRCSPKKKIENAQLWSSQKSLQMSVEAIDVSYPYQVFKGHCQIPAKVVSWLL
jgi:hypothetical protein